MTVGLNAASGGLANLWLNVLAGTAVGATSSFVQLHTGDPGAAGTSNVSSFGSTGRKSITFASTTTGTISSSNTPSWATWAGTNGEVVTHISLWTAASVGTFLCSIALTASKTMSTGDTLNLTSGATSVSLTPIAA
jgi:hypothetical protein